MNKSKNVVEVTVLEYLKWQDYPCSLNGMYHNLHKKFRISVLEKALNVLVEKGKIVEIPYGYQKAYVVQRSQLSQDLSRSRPNYEAMIKSGELKVSHQHQRIASYCTFRGRPFVQAKRHTVVEQLQPVLVPVENTIADETESGESEYNLVPTKSVEGDEYPTEHPFNKESYKYILAEPDPNASYRQKVDEMNEWARKRVHGWMCRAVKAPSVLLALHDRAAQLTVSEDRLSVTGHKGYCMIRATHGVDRGSWYFEAKITDMPEGSATRIGFCQQFANLQGPVGYDRFGYSWRSLYGTAFHQARGKSYVKGGYGLNDVLGFLIVLPDKKRLPLLPLSFKDRPLVKVRSHVYYINKDNAKDVARRDVRRGSQIVCFKNGVCQGVAFQDIYSGTYFPAISLFHSATVKTNFGPDFWAPPPPEYQFKPMSDQGETQIINQTMADMVYFTELDAKTSK